MKGKMLFVIGSAAFAVISCNGGMPNITSKDAIQLANEMKKRQDEDHSENPNNYIIEEFVENNIEEKHEFGFWQNKIKNTHTEFFDLPNLRYRLYDNAHYINHDKETDEIYFYENNRIYHLINENGYKTREEELCDKTIARNRLIDIRNERAIKKIRWRSIIDAEMSLDNFGKWVNEYEAKSEEYKKHPEAHKDEYIKQEYKSDNFNSLQVIIDERIRKDILEDVAPEGSRSKFRYNGLVTSNMNRILKNDVTESIYIKESFNCPSTEYNNFYKKRNSESMSKFTYGNAVIKLPNIEDYIPINY